MKICTKCKENKSLDSFYPRKNRPSGLTTKCKICLNEAANIRHKKNPRSKEANTLAAAKFRIKNPTYYHGAYKIAKQRNPLALRELWARKRANRRNAIPKWLTKEQRQEIKDIYLNCPEGFHVDHIVPIAGKDVKGLHVPWNLQYLTVAENLSKNNKFIQGNQ